MRIAVASAFFTQPSVRSAVLVLAWIALTVAVYAFNGLSDLEGDRLNGSTRPLASGQLTERQVRWACSILAVVSLGLAWWCRPADGLTALACLVLGWAYSAGPSLKQTAAGVCFTIIAGAALTYLAGCLEQHRSVSVTLLLLVASCWIGACSGVKDLSDREGDAAAGRRTWPVRFGTQRACALLVAVSAVAVVPVGVLAAVADNGFLAVPAVLVAGTVGVALTMRRLDDSSTRARRRQPYKAFMATQFLLNIAVCACAI